jgi:hypothetical protein
MLPQGLVSETGLYRSSRRLSAVGATVVLLFASALNISEAVAQGSESAPVRVARQNLPAVVTVVALDSHDQPLSLGSGFFISRAGVIATNMHVIQGALRVVIRWREQTGSANRIVSFDPKYDLVTLQSSFTSTPSILLGDSDSVTIGQDIIALGNPQGLEGTVSTGIVSGIRDLDGAKLLQITAPISPGSSGGPVFDNQGRVVGVATATLAKGQNLNFALPSNLLKTLPPSAIDLAAARLSPSQPTKSQDVLTVTNVIEQFINLHGAIYDSSMQMLSDTLDRLTVSLLNKSEHTIADPVLLVIIKSPTGDVLTFHLNNLKEVVIPPGLAKQVSLTAYAAGYGELRGGFDASKFRKGSYEIRILDFRIVSHGSGAVEQLFRKR